MGTVRALAAIALIVVAALSIYAVFMGVYHAQHPGRDFWQRVVAGLIAAFVAGIVLLLWIVAAIIILGAIR